MKNALPGPLMIDVDGTTLTDVERSRLCDPLVGGVILFSRNYENPAQLRALCDEIHSLRQPELLIAIDHEGGRVQRCRTGFTRLPAMRRLGEAWERDARFARDAAKATGYVLAAELRACGVDLSFTPVLDLDWGRSSVIGDRAFHGDAEIVVELAGALIEGLRAAGMSACGKHFPGHGWVEADSHIAIPIDERPLEALQTDLLPYRKLALNAVMPAHVSYPACDQHPAGFSSYWIEYLRNNIKFNGVIFSDDLSMEGASVVGGIIERANAAYEAGCDMLLVCNAPHAAAQLLEHWKKQADPVRGNRVLSLKAGVAETRASEMVESDIYRNSLTLINALQA